jgi:hypothetical protein
MAPSTTIGAIILLWRRAATKVIVSHFPSGTLPITRTPDAALPLSRAMLVLTASLVDKHQPRWVKKTLLSYRTAARSRNVCSLAFRRLQAFF